MKTYAGYHRFAGPWQPTAAQQRVLDGVAGGESNPVIAQRLGLSPETVKSHIAVLLAETGCEYRTELARWWECQEREPLRGGRRALALTLALAALLLIGLALAALLVLAARGGAWPHASARRHGNTAKAQPAAPTVPGADAAPATTAPSSFPLATPLPYDQPDPASSPTGNGPVVYLGQIDGGSTSRLDWPTALALDTHDNLYVMDCRNSRIVKFDPGGRVLTTWGSQGTGDGEFAFFVRNGGGCEGGITVDASGTVYVIDNGGQVQLFDGDGRFLRRWPGGGLGTGNGQFDLAGAIGRDAQGNFYLTDGSRSSAINNRVQKFNPQGTFLTALGSQGSGDGEFQVPFGVAVTPEGEVYVADLSNHRVQVLDSQGRYLRQWGTFGRGPGEFDRPAALAIDANGNVYVSDEFQHRVEKFDSQGRYLGEWGSYGTGNGRFNLTAGIVIDSHGDIYVVDLFNNRIQKFRPR